MLNFKSNSLIKSMSSSLINLPSPSFITYKWNLGFILSMVLVSQIISGLFLSMHYKADISLSFDNIVMIARDSNMGWAFRLLHANGASFFFLIMYLHIGRGLYYFSFNQKLVWNIGVIIVLVSMLTAFVGYVLPWGQMSFWGATVITNLISVIPYMGKFLVEWVWGGFSVGMPTLNRFYSFHFLFPFIIAALVLIHLIFLHDKGSFNPLGVNSNFDKINFHPYFTWKDFMSYLVLLFLLIVIMFKYPYSLGDPENFIPSNPLSTPPHIQPEWYLLFAYSILQAIPNKLGGVIFLVMSILILSIYALMFKSSVMNSSFLPVNKMMFWAFIVNAVLLTWLGACPVESPYIEVGQLMTLLYFLYFMFNSSVAVWWVRVVF
uniref:Cytochrome b n=1 Tax=Acerentomon microrhinus TaxID=996308 RepID=A0A0C4FSS1_9HEXA|nr:cytochrome b [Acerentomon microrhinus]AFI54924.1 cytochrome b [Acerentomon microrhinus]